MQLTHEEQTWLDGGAGPATQRAMEIVVALASIYGAERLIPVESVQISGVSFRNIGDAGLDFLRRWADEGARVRVPTTLNPTAMDMVDWRCQGFDPEFAAKQQQVVDTFARMGVGEGTPVPTCTPYLIGNRPTVGVHVAWAESSAVSFVNGVLGARTNREGGPGAIAAAIVGRTGGYGLHLDVNRRATVRVDVRVQPETISDYSALGALVGKQTRKAVPYFRGLVVDVADPLREEKLKALGAAMAATGAVALYHVEGVTPEVLETPELVGPSSASQMETLIIEELSSGYALLSDDVDAIDLVWIGCPHASLAEIARVADLIRGQPLRLPLWITCARPVRAVAAERGLVDVIEAAGGKVFADACMAIAPVRDLGFTAVATASAKGAYYLRNLAKVNARFGTVAQCLRTAVEGEWSA